MKPPLLAPIPRTVTWLGYGGLLPLLILAAAALVDSRHALLWSHALFAYGAVILSFVGALHWAFAMTLSELSTSRRRACFVWSVVPALIAWAALLLAPMGASALLVAGFLAHYWRDRQLVGDANLSPWYLPLRLRLTIVACLCLAAVGFANHG